MSYFSLFTQSPYDFNRDGVYQNVVDIYKQVRPIQNYVDQISAYRYYSIPNGARPDIVSQKLYGNSQFHWTFFLVNDFLHDGIGSWPMSQEDLMEYMKTEYEAVAIETVPQIVRNTDGLITDYKNSIANRFNLDETITGATSGAKGTLVKKDLFNNQLILKDVTGNFKGNARGTGITEAEEVKNSDDEKVTTYHVYDYIDAPHHWYDPTDPTKTQVSNAQFFSDPGADWSTETRLDMQFGSVAGLTYPDNVVTNRAYVNDLNEQRSKIRVIDAAYIQKFVDTFESMVNV